MLKEQSQANDGPMPFSGRAVTIALLAAVGLGAAVLAVRLRCRRRDAFPPDKNSSKNAAAAKTTLHTIGFDLSYIPTNANGFAAVRPAAIFENAETRPLLDKLNAEIAKHIPTGVPKLESIEQATVGPFFQPQDLKKGRHGGSWQVA